MAKKTTKKYYFSVEGETEHWYLKWIQDKINNTEQAICRVAIDCPVRKDPVKHAKCLNVTQKVEVYHFFDYESDEQAHVNAFMSAMDNMKKAERIGKQITYRSGYSRQMIEIGFLRGFFKKSQFSFLFFLNCQNIWRILSEIGQKSSYPQKKPKKCTKNNEKIGCLGGKQGKSQSATLSSRRFSYSVREILFVQREDSSGNRWVFAYEHKMNTR